MQTPSFSTNFEKSYSELKTELWIGETGALFLALYQDERTPERVINRLKADLPEHFEFPIYLDEYKLQFPLFFHMSFEPTGQQSNIFHVMNLPQLSEDSLRYLLHSLQHGRDYLETGAYSLVFWITPQLEKELFRGAPDFHHWVSHTYDFVELAADNANFQSSPSLLPLNKINGYLEKVIWQYEHWQEVKESGEDFLIEVMERANLREYYVTSYCKDKKGKKHSLDELLQEFLAKDASHFLTLLGDFGTGKSSFSLHHYIHLARQYSEDHSNRIPIFISLKGYPGRLNIEQFILQEFYQKFDIQLSFDIFQNLALQGKFVFFVDGFDEMASLSEQELTLQNFKELTKLTFENVLFMTDPSGKTKKANKVFLTCRTHYFLSAAQETELLRADYTILYRNYATKSNYQIARIHLQEFNDQQIKQYVLKHIQNQQETESILGIIKNTYNLQELSTRPLLLEMIVKTIPSLKGKGSINAASLYQAYTGMWIERDDWRSQMTAEGKRHFMWQLALKMLNKGGGDFSLHYSELDKPNTEHLKKNFAKEEDYYKYETTTCSFLHRDSEGNYKFVHKSFMEYFLAECFFDSIKKKKTRVVDYEKLNEETKFFLKLFVSLNKTGLDGLDLNSLSLTKIDLNGASLRGANLSGVDLRETNLGGVDLRQFYLRGVDLSEADLSEADLSEADLSEADLHKADLRKADLRKANLSGTYLNGTYLWKVNLHGANLSRANLSRADLWGTDLGKANLSDVDLRKTNLSGANLSEADLRGANLRGSDLFGTVLSNTLYSKKTQFPDRFKPAAHNMILLPEENQEST